MHASFEGNYSSFCTDPACQITTTNNNKVKVSRDKPRWRKGFLEG